MYDCQTEIRFTSPAERPGGIAVAAAISCASDACYSDRVRPFVLAGGHGPRGWLSSGSAGQDTRQGHRMARLEGGNSRSGRRWPDEYTVNPAGARVIAARGRNAGRRQDDRGAFGCDIGSDFRNARVCLTRRASRWR